MKRIYIKPVAEELSCDMSGMLAASTNSTDWVWNPDGNNPSTISDGKGKDPDADDARGFGGLFEDEDF